MQLGELRIDLLPGISSGFTLNLKPGVNLVCGPNGSGKSSLTRAVFHLLWPQLEEINPCQVTAHFRLGDHRWQAVRQEGRPVQWYRDGQPIDPPGLPDSHLARSYRLGMLDLNPAKLGEDDRNLAHQIRTQMDGGYDLTGSERDLFTIRTQLGTRENRQLEEAGNAVRNIHRDQASLARRERDLGGRQNKLKEARHAHGQIQLIKTLLAERRHLKQLAELQGQLEGMPPGLDRFSDQDPKQLGQWLEREGKAIAERDSLQGNLDRLRKKQAALAWPATAGEDFTLDLLDELVDQLTEQERELGDIGKDLAGLRFVTVGTGPEAEDPRPEPVDGKTFLKLLELHQELLKSQADQEARRLLLDEVSRQLPRRVWQPALLLLAGLALIIGGMIGPGQSWTAPLAFTGGLAALAASFLLGQRRTGRMPDQIQRLEHELNRKESDIAATREELEGLARQHGLDLARPNLFHDLKEAAQRLGMQQEQDKVAGQWEHARRDRDETLDRINAQLQTLGLDRVATLAEARAVRKELRRRQTDLTEAASSLAAEQQKLDTEVANLDQADQAMREIVKRLGLRDDEPALPQVKLLEDSHPLWQKANEDLAVCQAQLAECRAELQQSGQPGELESLRALDDGQLESRQEELSLLAGEADTLAEEIASLKVDLDQARTGHDLEQALAAADSARQKLADRRDEARRDALGRLLLEQVRQQSETRSRPPVLKHAQSLFQEFTGRRYELLVGTDDQGNGTFRARDLRTTLPLELNQLSAGTRAQLLLAVRLGFIFRAESDVRPPLFLDDSLSSSDPERFAAVAANLGQLAAEHDRQIVFLTPDPVDVQAWDLALRNAGLPAPHTIDLARERQLPLQATPGQLQPTVPDPVPAPGGHDAAGYARLLGVPVLDRWAAPEAAHLFYLLDDHLGLMHTLLQAGFSAVGPWLRQHGNAAHPAGLSPDQASLVDLRCQVWQAVLAAWRQGRNRPLTMDDLMPSGAITDTMRPRIAGVLEECAGDPVRFLASLHQGKVARFQEDKKNLLQEYLEQADLLDSRDPLDEDALVRSVQSSLSPLIQAGRLEVAEARRLTLTLTAYLNEAD
jgi:exonuclease SbcC